MNYPDDVSPSHPNFTGEFEAPEGCEDCDGCDECDLEPPDECDHLVDG